MDALVPRLATNAMLIHPQIRLTRDSLKGNLARVSELDDAFEL
jgi:hypothetical protein